MGEANWIAEYEDQRRQDAAVKFAAAVLKQAGELEPEIFRWLGWGGIQAIEKAIIQNYLALPESQKTTNESLKSPTGGA